MTPVPTIAFFNNKGGVGKTSLVAHVAWMLAEFGCRVVVADLDPQSNLTSYMVPVDRLQEIADQHLTMYSAVLPLIDGIGDIASPFVEPISDNLGLIPGDLSLSIVEEEFNAQWPKCLDRNQRAFRVTTAFSRAIQSAARDFSAQFALIDMGPNLGALNRAALVSADYVVIPLGPDVYSLQGLSNLGRRLHDWRQGWEERRTRLVPETFALPHGGMCPLGYVVMKRTERLDRPVKAYEYWMQKIPSHFAREILGAESLARVEDDPNCLAWVKDYRSLMPIAQDANKPIFSLGNRERVFGANSKPVADCRQNFLGLTREILIRIQRFAPRANQVKANRANSVR